MLGLKDATKHLRTDIKTLTVLPHYAISFTRPTACRFINTKHLSSLHFRTSSLQIKSPVKCCRRRCVDVYQWSTVPWGKGESCVLLRYFCVARKILSQSTSKRRPLCYAFLADRRLCRNSAVADRQLFRHACSSAKHCNCSKGRFQQFFLYRHVNSMKVLSTSLLYCRRLDYIVNTVSCTVLLTVQSSGFRGIEVACWPLVPNFAGSNPAETVGFFRAK